LHPGLEVVRVAQGLAELGFYLIMPPGMLTAAGLVIFFCSDRIKDAWLQLIGFWPILAPSIALFLMYAMIVWWPRYISWILVTGFSCLIASANISAEVQRERVLRAAGLALGAIFIGVVLQDVNGNRFDSRISIKNVETAEQLQMMGIEPGSRVAVIGEGFTEEYWARLDRAKIVAEVPRTLNTGDSEAAFWSSGIEGERAVLDALKSTGAMAAVADLPPKVLPQGWIPVAKTGRAVYFFR
jgi:hypothetical protein